MKNLGLTKVITIHFTQNPMATVEEKSGQMTKVIHPLITMNISTKLGPSVED